MSSEGRSGAASGGQLEHRIDCSVETAEQIQQATALIQASPDNLRDALSLLTALEKRCRVGNDLVSLTKVCEACLQLCKDCGDDDALVATLKTLSTRRSQKSKAIAALVHKALPWALKEAQAGGGIGTPIDVATEKEKAARDRLVETLRDITDGKLFLEAERARLTRALAAIKVSLSRTICCTVRPRPLFDHFF